MRARKSCLDEEKRKRKIFFLVRRDIERGRREEAQLAEEEFNEQLMFSKVWPSCFLLKMLFTTQKEKLEERVELLVKEKRELRLIKHLQLRGKNYLLGYGKTAKERACKMTVRSMKVLVACSVISMEKGAASTLYSFL